jgi:glutamine amidotransferase-like uncharacterized protein
MTEVFHWRLWEGGGYFIPLESDIEGKTYEVLARYMDEPEESSLAIIRCVVGSGTVTLCFPHLEREESEARFVYESFSRFLEKGNGPDLKGLEKYKKPSSECLGDLKRLCKGN